MHSGNLSLCRFLSLSRSLFLVSTIPEVILRFIVVTSEGAGSVSLPLFLATRDELLILTGAAFLLVQIVLAIYFYIKFDVSVSLSLVFFPKYSTKISCILAGFYFFVVALSCSCANYVLCNHKLGFPLSLERAKERFHAFGLRPMKKIGFNGAPLLWLSLYVF